MTAKKIDHDAIWNKYNGRAKPNTQEPATPNEPEPLGEGFDDPEPEDDDEAQAPGVPAGEQKMTPAEEAAALNAMAPDAFAKFNGRR